MLPADNVLRGAHERTYNPVAEQDMLAQNMSLCIDRLGSRARILIAALRKGHGSPIWDHLEWSSL